jgi:hypothetical protein
MSGLWTFIIANTKVTMRIPTNPTSDSDLKASSVPTQSIQV